MDNYKYKYLKYKIKYLNLYKKIHGGIIQQSSPKTNSVYSSDNINVQNRARYYLTKTYLTPNTETMSICPKCKENMYYVKVFNNSNTCHMCDNNPKIIFLSFCGHLYCEACFSKFTQNDPILTQKFPILTEKYPIFTIGPQKSIDKTKSCNNQETLMNKCHICRVYKKFILLENINIECGICYDIRSEMLLGCCGHYMCKQCYTKIAMNNTIKTRNWY
jgi:hypothetical protein